MSSEEDFVRTLFEGIKSTIFSNAQRSSYEEVSLLMNLLVEGIKIRLDNAKNPGELIFLLATELERGIASSLPKKSPNTAKEILEGCLDAIRKDVLRMYDHVRMNFPGGEL